MPQPLSRIASAAYTAKALAQYLPRPLLRKLAGRSYKRTPESVIAEYHGVRADYLARFRATPPPLDDYLLFEADFGPDDQIVHCCEGRLVFGSIRESNRRRLQQVLDGIARYQPASVLEVGCGAGHNLLAIKHAYPAVRCVGLELTAPSVELAMDASRHYGLPIDVQQADVTKPWPDLEPVDVCFSVHALEQIPEARAVLDRMRAIARKGVVLFEPLTECWPKTLRLVAGRIRARHLDRLRGLYPYIQAHDWIVDGPTLIPNGRPLNPGVELHIKSAE